MERARSSILKTVKANTLLIERLDLVVEVAKILDKALRGGRTIFLMAQGPFAFLAQHAAAEFIGKFATDTQGEERRPLPIVALTEDASLLSAVGSNYGTRHILARQVVTFVKKDDAVLCLTLNGSEGGLREALHLSKERGAVTVAVTGQDADEVEDLCDLCLRIPSKSQFRVEECQLIILHTVYNVIQDEMARTGEFEKTGAIIRFECPNCAERIAVMSRFAGRKGTCPRCHVHVTVPTPEPSAAAQEPAAAEQRSHMRFSVKDCVLDVMRLKDGTLGERLKGHLGLEDLSQGGVQFLHLPLTEDADEEMTLSVGDRIRVRLNTPAFTEPITGTGEVRRVEPIKGKRGARYGVKFLALDSEAADKLRRLEDNVVLRNLARAPSASSS